MKTKFLIGGLVGLSLALNAQNTTCHFDLSLLPGTGLNNAGFGLQTMTVSTTGDFNSALGNLALRNNASGVNNAAVGYQALFNNTTGNNNVAVGYQTLLGATTNQRNTAIGHLALNTLGAGLGDLNTALGFKADVGVAGLVTNASAIGANAQVMATNNMILGNNLVNVGIGLSANPLGPQSKLEISTGVPATSGLQFRNLNALSPVIINPGPGVLALDAAGKVIYVGAGGGGGGALGNLCGAAPNALTGNYELPMANFNYNFTLPATTAAGVFLGYAGCVAAPVARLDVTDDNIGKGIKGYCSSATNNNIGIDGVALDPGTAGGPITTIGMLGESTTGPLVVGNRYAGVAGFCRGAAALNVLPVDTDCAIYGNSKANGGIYAGFFEGDVRIVGTAAPSMMGALFPPGGPYALDVQGNAITSAAAWYLSDRRFKQNIRPLESSLDKLAKLGGYNYDYRITEFPSKRFNGGNQIGLIAQEVKEIFPELVHQGPDGYYAVNYQGLIPVLLEGIKELKTQLAEQKQLLENSGQKSSGGSTGSNPLNEVENGFQMSQNEPNPFTHETVVKYTLPTSISNAFMAVYDLTGKQLTTFPIRQMGSYSLTITSDNLPAGIYIYSIVADGKIVDSKRMIVAE